MPGPGGFPQLRWFAADEFQYPDRMDPGFLYWLDRVRTVAKVPMVITDDYRVPGEAPTGASPSSLHYLGRAVDIRSRNWTAADKWKVLEAVVTCAPWAPGAVECELVHSATDQHWHIGMRPSGPHRIIEADE